jgi:hypothetical protein
MLYSPYHLVLREDKMSIHATRREFLKLSTAGLASSVTPGILRATANAREKPEASGQVEVWTTNQKLRCQKTGTLTWH